MEQHGKPSRKDLLIGGVVLVVILTIAAFIMMDSEEEVLAEEFEDHLVESFSDVKMAQCDEPKEVAMNRSFHCDVRVDNFYTDAWQQKTMLITLMDEDGYDYRWSYVD